MKKVKKYGTGGDVINPQPMQIKDASGNVIPNPYYYKKSGDGYLPTENYSALLQSKNINPTNGIQYANMPMSPDELVKLGFQKNTTGGYDNPLLNTSGTGFQYKHIQANPVGNTGNPAGQTDNVFQSWDPAEQGKSFQTEADIQKIIDATNKNVANIQQPGRDAAKQRQLMAAQRIQAESALKKKLQSDARMKAKESNYNYDTGGPIINPELSKGIKDIYSIGNKSIGNIDQQISADAIGGGVDNISNYANAAQNKQNNTTSLINLATESAASGIDYLDRKNGRSSIAGQLLSGEARGVGKGAAIGMNPALVSATKGLSIPIGIGIGAVVGGAAGAKRGIAEKKARQEQVANDVNSFASNAQYDPNNPNATYTSENYNSKDFKRGWKGLFAKGGQIKGPGTGTSDSIPAKLKEGSFIVPAKNAAIANKIRKHMLGMEEDAEMENETMMHEKKEGKEEKADLNQKGGMRVKVSNGEHLFTPEEVKELTAAGVNLDKLAPEAKNKLRSEYKCGGKIPMYAKGGLNFSSAANYHKWLGYVHAKGLAESTPGNQKVSIRKEPHKVQHNMDKGGHLTSAKAKEILHDGTIRGHKITDAQRRYFGAVATGHNKYDDGGKVVPKGTKMQYNGQIVTYDGKDWVTPNGSKYYGDQSGKKISDSYFTYAQKVNQQETNRIANQQAAKYHTYQRKLDEAIKSGAPDSVIKDYQDFINQYEGKTPAAKTNIPAKVPLGKSKKTALGTSLSKQPIVADQLNTITPAFPKTTIKEPGLKQTNTLTPEDKQAYIQAKYGVSPDNGATNKILNQATGYDPNQGLMLEQALAAGQAGLGLRNLLKDKRPIRTVDQAFNQATENAIAQARTGYTPSQMATLKNQIVEGKNAQIAGINAIAGGNAAVGLNNSRSAINNMMNKNLQLASEDERLRMQKQQYANQLVGERANMRNQIFNDKMNAYLQNQQAGASLLGAGLRNLVGAQRYRQEQQSQQQINKIMGMWQNGIPQ